jgi:hypothetical protein
MLPQSVARHDLKVAKPTEGDDANSLEETVIDKQLPSKVSFQVRVYPGTLCDDSDQDDKHADQSEHGRFGKLYCQLNDHRVTMHIPWQYLYTDSEAS